MDANRKSYLYAFADVPADRFTHPVGDGDQYGYICSDGDNLYCNGNPDKLAGTSANVNGNTVPHVYRYRVAYFANTNICRVYSNTVACASSWPARQCATVASAERSAGA